MSLTRKNGFKERGKIFLAKLSSSGSKVLNAAEKVIHIRCRERFFLLLLTVLIPSVQDEDGAGRGLSQWLRSGSGGAVPLHRRNQLTSTPVHLSGSPVHSEPGQHLT